MSIDLEGSLCESEAARLLPWFVTGRLSPPDVERVTRHLEHCAICRTDLEHERALRGAMKAEGTVELAPQAGLALTLARIDELTRDAPPAVPQRRRSGERGRRPTLTQWLTAAVIVQAIGLAALTGAQLRESSREPARRGYETLSSPAVTATGAQIRAVFARSMTVAELTHLLAAERLLIVAGPSDAGVFTLASLEPATDAEHGIAQLARLRADGHVLLAEPVVAAGAGRR